MVAVGSSVRGQEGVEPAAFNQRAGTEESAATGSEAESAASPSEPNEAAKADTNADGTQVIPASGDRANGASEIMTVSFEAAHPHSVAMTTLHNQYRSQAGLSAQSVDAQLSLVAQRWAEHMASVGSMYHGGGEQIIAYSGGDLSYEAGFRLWLNSSPHRAWLYSRGNLCGFGYAIGRNGCAYFAGAFGSSPIVSESTVSESTVSESSSESGSYRLVSSSNGRRIRLFRRRG
jgi:uncharacterized protein YkwD